MAGSHGCLCLVYIAVCREGSNTCDKWNACLSCAISTDLTGGLVQISKLLQPHLMYTYRINRDARYAVSAHSSIPASLASPLPQSSQEVVTVMCMYLGI